MECQCADARDGCTEKAHPEFSFLCIECEERGCKARTPRRAIVEGQPLPKVQQYLPLNYKARRDGDAVEVYGYDDHGWTLDGYVIPRLGSGLIAAREVTD